MKTFKNPPRKNWQSLCQRPTSSVADIENTVTQIFDEVKQKGDKAVRKYTSFFDNTVLDEIAVAPQKFKEAENAVPESLKRAILMAKSNIEKFHKAQIGTNKLVTTQSGINCWIEKRPIERVGLYIPGGTAPLFSTVLMLAVPAAIAGCNEIVMCTPPDKNGTVNPVLLYTAGICGIKQIYTVGGIQAIAAMTFGTKTIPAVYKIFGPGNQFVTVAKQMATKYGVAIDMPAGPSELLVFADKKADADFVAADLLSQAEHGTDSQVILVSTLPGFSEQVIASIQKQITDLPRKKTAEKALKHAKFICFEDDATSLDFINEYGPEHFIICSHREDLFVRGILNAGSVFIGNYAPEAAGDYASGTNHTLPTNGFSKAYSGVNLDSFLKSISFQKITKKGLQTIGPGIELMAEAEGLIAHRNAVSIRLKKISDEKI